MSLPNTLYTTDQVKNIEQFAINECAIPSFTLMQDAGQAAFDEIRKHYPKSKSMCVICGAGNNGGDGYIVAKLARQDKFKVTLIQLGNADSVSGDALLAKKKYEKGGGMSFNYDKSLISEQLDVDIIVDAIFGTGLSRDVAGDYLTAIEAIIAKSKVSPSTKVIAIDIPSGLSADTGSVFGSCVKANVTVTFVGLKRGLFTAKARDYVGEIAFDSLSIPDNAHKQLPQTYLCKLISDDILKQQLKPRPRASHKGNFGHVLLIGGDQGMAGAIRLAAEAALRCGTGLVSVATHPSHASTINIGRPEIMVHGIAQALALLPLVEKATVIVIGPGLGLSEWSRALFEQAISSDLPTVIDADALNLLAEKKSSLTIKENWILTPHPKEMARLLDCSTTEIEANRFEQNKRYLRQGAIETTKIHKNSKENSKLKAKNSGGVSVLKGAGTLISNQHQTLVCTKGNPGMSSGGMGDVLSGVIAAMLAQGLSLFDAASAGVYLHAAAADIAAQDGERGLLASDLFPYLRALVNHNVE